MSPARVALDARFEVTLDNRSKVNEEINPRQRWVILHPLNELIGFQFPCDLNTKSTHVSQESKATIPTVSVAVNSLSNLFK